MIILRDKSLYTIMVYVTDKCILRCMSGYIFQKPYLLLIHVYENGNYFDATIDMPIHVFCFKLSTVLDLFGKYNIIIISIIE